MFENHMGSLKRLLKKANKHLEQLFNRVMEKRMYNLTGEAAYVEENVFLAGITGAHFLIIVLGHSTRK